MTGNSTDLEQLFRGEGDDRGKFLSRVFGIFNEEIVRIWCRDARSSYSDLGRPTIYLGSQSRGSTLDFTLQNRETAKLYVAEMKCEIQWNNYKYLILTEPSQLEHHQKKAFADFLTATRHPGDAMVTIQSGQRREEAKVDGGVLIWGAVAEAGRSSVSRQFAFADILSLEEIIADLNRWENREFGERIQEWKRWCDSMFEGLLRIT